jgi:hypothetical protein
VPRFLSERPWCSAEIQPTPRLVLWCLFGEALPVADLADADADAAPRHCRLQISPDSVFIRSIARYFLVFLRIC